MMAGGGQRRALMRGSTRLGGGNGSSRRHPALLLVVIASWSAGGVVRGTGGIVGHLFALLFAVQAVVFRQGACLFGLNYWLVYLAEEHLTSGLVAVIFSGLIFINIFTYEYILKLLISNLY